MSRLFRSSPRSGLGCMALFAAPFALVGLVVDLSLIKLGYDDLQMLSWRETPCTILAAELIEDHGGDSTTRRITARYRYTVGGVEHDGARVSLDFGSDNVGTWHQRTFAELEEYRQSTVTRGKRTTTIYRWLSGVPMRATDDALRFSGAGRLWSVLHRDHSPLGFDVVVLRAALNRDRWRLSHVDRHRAIQGRPLRE